MFLPSLDKKQIPQDIFENNTITTYFQPGIERDSVKQSIFGALVSIAQENGIKVLAEGVETREELAYVKQHGAELAQRYLFAKPSAEPVRRLEFGVAA